MRRRRLVLTSSVAVGALSLLAAGCGGGGSAPPVASTTSSPVRGAAGSSATTSQSHALFLVAQCFRQHGIPNFPDPTIASSGPAEGRPILDKGALRAVPNAVVSQATLACRTAMAQAGIASGPNGAANPQDMRDKRDFARCMRTRGVPRFPDPTGQGELSVEMVQAQGIDVHSPQFLRVVQACLPASHGALTPAKVREALNNAGG